MPVTDDKPERKVTDIDLRQRAIEALQEAEKTTDLYAQRLLRALAQDLMLLAAQRRQKRQDCGS